MDLSSLDLDAVTVHQPRMPATDIAIALDWAQETDQVKFFLPLVGVLHGLRARDLDLKIRASRIEITRRGTNGKVLAAGTLGGKVDPSECEWEVAKEELVVSLRKTAQREWAHALQLDALVEELNRGRRVVWRGHHLRAHRHPPCLRLLRLRLGLGLRRLRLQRPYRPRRQCRIIRRVPRPPAAAARPMAAWAPKVASARSIRNGISSTILVR